MEFALQKQAAQVLLTEGFNRMHVKPLGTPRIRACTATQALPEPREMNHCIRLRFMQVGRTTNHSEFKGSTIMSLNSMRHQRKCGLNILGGSWMLSHFSHAQMALIYAKEEHIFFLSEQQDTRGCCFIPGNMALEDEAREAGEGCSFCRATTTLLSLCHCHGPTSEFHWDVQVRHPCCSLAPAVQELGLWEFDCRAPLEARCPNSPGSKTLAAAGGTAPGWIKAA